MSSSLSIDIGRCSSFNSTHLCTVGDRAFPAAVSWTRKLELSSAGRHVVENTILTFKSNPNWTPICFLVLFLTVSFLCTVIAVCCITHFKFLIMIVMISSPCTNKLLHTAVGNAEKWLSRLKNNNSDWIYIFQVFPNIFTSFIFLRR